MTGRARQEATTMVTADTWREKATAWLAQYDGDEDKEDSVDGLAELMANEALFSEHLNLARKRINEQVQADLYRMLSELIRASRHDGWSVKRTTASGTLELENTRTGDTAQLAITNVDARLTGPR